MCLFQNRIKCKQQNAPPRNIINVTNSMYAKGFTLLEIMIAIFIFASVLSTIFISYTGTFNIIDKTESRSNIYRMARIALERMQEDLESAYFSTHSTPFVGKDREIDGRDADALNFVSRAHVVFDEEEENPGIAWVSYYVQESDNGDGLILYRSDTPEFAEAPEEGTGGLILCDGLSSVDFIYYDADGKPYDTWDSTGDGLKDKFPVMVEIELSFIDTSDTERPVKFGLNVSFPMGKAG